MKKLVCSSFVLVVCLCLFCFAQSVDAAIEVSGDVDPANPATWMSANYVHIGKTGSGTLNITDGDAVNNNYARIGYDSGSTGKVVVDGSNSIWNNNGGLSIGSWGKGTLSITAGGAVSSELVSIGGFPDSIGEVTVDGSGSTWNNSGEFYVGFWGSGRLNITGGGAVSSGLSGIGFGSGSTGDVVVDGSGSIWFNNSKLRIGFEGNGTLNIIGGGLVSAAGGMSTGANLGNGFVNMSTGGMLALNGQADSSLADFLGLIDGTDAIRYWDDSISDWAYLAGATYGQDYTLTYITEGDLDGYTMLTVPEPATLLLLGVGGLILRKRRN